MVSVHCSNSSHLTQDKVKCGSADLPVPPPSTDTLAFLSQIMVMQLINTVFNVV